MDSPPRRRRSRGQFSHKTPDRLMAQLRDADALMAKPHWRVGDFPKNSARWNACTRRYWHEKVPSGCSLPRQRRGVDLGGLMLRRLPERTGDARTAHTGHGYT